MSTLIVKTENQAAAKLLLAFLKTVRLVKSVTLSPEKDKKNILNEPTEGYSWVNPSRPATNKEIDVMLDECEAQFKSGDVLAIDEAEEKMRKKLAAWKRIRVSR